MAIALPEGISIFGLGGGSGSSLSFLINLIIGLIIVLVVFTIVGVILWRRNEARKYNIPLIIITPRSDGRIVEINNGVGGYFKSKKVGGITSFRIKRKGIATVDIPPPLSSFLSAPNRTLILAQKGIDDYEPVHPSSLSYVMVDGIDKPVMILDLKAINQDATAWMCDNSETSKKRFTFGGLWEKHSVLISLFIFVIILFIIIFINWMGMKDVVTALGEVADKLGNVGGGSAIVTGG